jgi:hypothetical protein
MQTFLVQGIQQQYLKMMHLQSSLQGRKLAQILYLEQQNLKS